MFAVAGLDSLHGFLASRKWVHVGAASFEERSLAFSRLAIASHLPAPVECCELFPEDRGSAYEKPCSEQQQINSLAMQATTGWPTNTLKFDLSSPDAGQLSRDAVRATVARCQPDVVVVDITTMPKVCFFPVIRDLLTEQQPVSVVATYARPVKYGTRQLQADPILPAAPLPGFGFLPPPKYGKPSEIAWLPILGFGSFFLAEVYEGLVASGRIDDRVFPMLGFPAFEPAFFERLLVENVEPVLALCQKIPGIRDRFLYAAASDPFGTRDVIVSAIAQLPHVHWVGTPLGPKPMALGMLLASLKSEISIVFASARTFAPDYSEGCGALHVYPLRVDGVCL